VEGRTTGILDVPSLGKLLACPGMHGTNDEAENEISFKPTCKGVSAAVSSEHAYNSPQILMSIFSDLAGLGIRKLSQC
jgi:hypothetical protein